MSLHRFFLQGPVTEGRSLPLGAGDLHHLRDVLRLGPGDEVVAVEPAGRALVVRLEQIAEEVRGEVVRELERESGPQAWLVQGVAKGERTDLAVRMAVEVGAAGVVPVLTERCVVRLDADKRRARGERWRRIALEAAKQAQRDEVPCVADPVELTDITAALPEGCRVIVPWEEASGRCVREALAAVRAAARGPVAVVVGPEGGLTADEVASLEDAGAVTCTLGGTILRTETAGLVACALVIYELGGLGNGG